MKFSAPTLRWVVIAICALAALRVFLFAAAFPFFNNVDEQAHVDLVWKYAHGQAPRGIENFSAEPARYFTLYSSPEYFLKPGQQGGEDLPPVWTLPADVQEQIIAAALPVWKSRPNHESGEPPLYYGIAGAWMNVGHALGIRGLALLYWVRFLDVAFAVALVGIGFIAARTIFPENQFLQVACPALLGVWPQSAFFSVQGDALSPVLFGIAFVGLAKLLGTERPSVVVAIWTGLAVAATCLVKTSNLPLPVLFFFALGLLAVTDPNKCALRKHLAAFSLSAAIPIAIWFARNHRYFGDLTATQSKIDLLGWTRKPFAEWWSHSIFTLHGFGEFWLGLSASFWRGEFVWHLERMTSPFTDAFYAAVTAVVIVASIIFLLRRSSAGKDRQLMLWVALLSFLSIVAFLILLSISFNFGDSPYPSREHPYFVSGRLLDAAALPFFLLFGYGLDRFGNWTKQDWIKWSLLGAILLFAIVSQMLMNAPAVTSPYNFFHYLWR